MSDTPDSGALRHSFSAVGLILASVTDDIKELAYPDWASPWSLCFFFDEPNVSGIFQRHDETEMLAR